MWDLIMDYRRVQRFLNSHPYRKAGVIGNDFALAARSVRAHDPDSASAEAVLTVVARSAYKKKCYEGFFRNNLEEALYVAEYYIAWAGLSLDERDAIKRNRFEALLQG